MLDHADATNTAISTRLKTVFIGGERVSAELILRTLRKCPGVRVCNLYGPSEATANASMADLTADASITIGRPIANTRIHLLDGNIGVVPIGWPAKLYIAGDGLARGYLNRADLTADRFIPDPFSTSPGARLYNSGDLARYLPDGKIDFLGRVDDQVKVHGFRIELGEIEAVLAAHPAVRDSVVLAIEGEGGEKRLQAFILARSGRIPTSSEMRNELRRHLPDYMIPSVFTWLEEMPVMPNGKVNRSILAKQAAATPVPDRSRVEAHSDLEKMVISAWSEALGISDIALDDDFFALGGHSILAMLVISRLREEFAVDLPMHLLFIAPTVAEFTAAIVQSMSDKDMNTEIDAVVTMPPPSSLSTNPVPAAAR